MSDRTGRFVAGGLVALGALIVGFAGPCTLFFGGGALFELVTGGDPGLSGFILMVALIFGGLPTAAGALLLVKSWRTFRR